MSTRWSNEKITAEHKDIEADVMSIHSKGRYVALSNFRTICIIDIENPSKIARTISRSSKWDVTASEWSPHQTSLLGLSYYHYIAVYSFSDVDSEKGVLSDTRRFQKTPDPQILLKGHRRVVTDFNWAPFDGNLLASCSMDTFVYVWDLREHRRPCLGFSSVVGPSQVKWSKSDENILATALEGDIRIWDKRKVFNPLHYVTAHDQRIHGLDWNPYNGSQFATCSQDCTVKFWELSTIGQQDPIILPTKLPVWRAKFTPFRDGLITVVVPQLRRTGDINSLWLWNTNNLEQPVHSFFGPTDVVIDFGWRWRPDVGAAELVTWSKDNTLRIWAVDKPILSLFNESNQEDSLEYSPAEGAENRSIFICNTINIGMTFPQGRSQSIRLLDNKVQYTTFSDNNDRLNTHDRGKGQPSDINSSAKSSDSKDVLINYKTKPSFSPSSAKSQNYKTSAVEPISSGLLTPPDLQEEFALINLDVYPFTSSNLRIEDLNPIKRHCIVSVETAFKSGHRVKLKIAFPNSYPNGIAPTFEILDDGELDKPKRNEILRILSNTASKQVKQNRACLEPCLRDFAAALDRKSHLNVSSLPNNSTSTSESDYSTLYGSFHDAQVPFPKICGGSFCGADMLVCFGKMSYLQRINDSNDHTPRALSDLSAYLQTNYRPLAPMPVKSFTDFATPKDNHSISSFPYYYGDNFRRFQSQGMERSYISLASMRCGSITIYNASELMPCSRTLAEKYVFNYKNRVDMCKKNAVAALEESRKDLHQTWNLVMLSCDPNLSWSSEEQFNLDAPWATHPFGRKMIQSLIDFYLKTMGDIQTAAMLCCLFTSRCTICGKLSCLQRNCLSGCDSNLPSYLPEDSPYHTISGKPTATAQVTSKSSDDWSIISVIKNFKRNRSSSWSDLGEGETPSSSYPILNSYRFECNEMDLLRDQREAERTEIDGKMLDPRLSLYFDCVKQLYGDLLLRWGLLGKRAQLMKYVPDNLNFPLDDSLKSLNYVAICQHCSILCSDSSPVLSQCNECKKLNLNCSLCNISVRGLVSFCHLCGHGGHTKHMLNWFTINDNCPTGCGCKCILEDKNV